MQQRQVQLTTLFTGTFDDPLPVLKLALQPVAGGRNVAAHRVYNPQLGGTQLGCFLHHLIHGIAFQQALYQMQLRLRPGPLLSKLQDSQACRSRPVVLYLGSPG